MTLPKWLAEELDALGRSVKSGELHREQVVDTLTDHALDKDADYVRSLVRAHLSGKLDSWLKARRKEAERRADQVASAGYHEGSFDDIASDFWPRETFGPLTTLADLKRYAEECRAMTDRFVQRDEERDRRLTELLRAANGDENVTWDRAERLRLGLEPYAAEG